MQPIFSCMHACIHSFIRLSSVHFKCMCVLCVPGLFTMRVPKETAGQHFEGLHMLTSLLAPKGSRSAQPLVEEIGML